MSAHWRSRNGRAIGTVLIGISLVVLAMVLLAEPEVGVAEEAATPPPDQVYVGTKKCAACHFPQFRVWKTDQHSKAFEVLPAKYREDAVCLKCHTTGFGKPTGFKDVSMTHLAGVSYEACHGPGSEHGKLAQKFVEEDITPEAEKMVRDSIHRIPPGNVCVECHQVKAHKAHPDFDKE